MLKANTLKASTCRIAITVLPTPKTRSLMQTPQDTTLITVPEEQHDAWTIGVLRSVWGHQRDRVSDRIAVIERAVAALADDRLDAELRREAERAAHMLAGSVGMFGFLGASDAARSLESGLVHPTPDRAPALLGLALAVREGVRGPVVLCSDVTADEIREQSH